MYDDGGDDDEHRLWCFMFSGSKVKCKLSFLCLSRVQQGKIHLVWYGMVYTYICFYITPDNNITITTSVYVSSKVAPGTMYPYHFINPHFCYITQCLCSVHSEITGKNHYLLIWAKSICKAWPFLLPVSENCHWPGQWVGSEYRRQQSI